MEDQIKEEPKKEKKTIKQVLKFVVVGLLNTGIDLVLLNLLIWISGAGRDGWVFTVFKGVSFVAAAANSYYFNKLWVFRGEDAEKKTSRQFTEFMVITVGGALINIGIASLFVNNQAPVEGFLYWLPGIAYLYTLFIQAFHAITPADFAHWATEAAMFGTAAGLVWNFLGYKFFVFRAKRKKK